MCFLGDCTKCFSQNTVLESVLSALQNRLKAWLGVTPDTSKRHFQVTMNATSLSYIELISNLTMALDGVYGVGWSKRNPQVVADYLQALSIKELASEVGALRDIIGSGSGAFTVGIERG